MSVRSRIPAMQQIAEQQKVTLPPLQDDLSPRNRFDPLAFAIPSRGWRTISALIRSPSRRTPPSVDRHEFVRAYENVPA